MPVSIIVAATDNQVIGKDNRLLWHLPADMKFFKSVTWTHPVIMGRKTFDSLGRKPLAGRTNIVITRQSDFSIPDVHTAGGLHEALDLARKTNVNEIFVIGGGDIYRQALPLATRVYLTRVHTRIEGDTFFPELNQDWHLVQQQPYAANDKHAWPFTIQQWERVSS